MTHLSPDQLSALLDGELSLTAQASAELHLRECEACREALATFTANQQALARVLDHEPGEEYFATFADRVTARVRAESATTARPRPGTSWWSAPRTLVLVGSTAAVVLGAGVVWLAYQNSAKDVMRSRALDSSSGQAATQPQAESEGSEGAREETRGSEPPATLDQSKEQASAPARERVTDRVAAPARAQQVRRNELGEDVPVDRSPAFARAPAADRPGESDIVKAKRRAIQPLRSEASKTQSPAKDERIAAPLPAATQADKNAESGASSRDAQNAISAPAPASSSLAPGAAEIATKLTAEAFGALVSACGIVRDGAGRPVQGATVMLLERGASARTDADGRYCLEAKAGSDSLIVSVIGFRSKRVPVEIESSGSLAAVTLDAVSALPSDALALRGGRADDARFRADGVAPGALAPAPAPAVAFPDSLKPLVARATQTFAEGKRRADASKLDAAAAEWERVLRAARPGAAELAARERIADARFAAWEAAPTSRRAAAAIEALTAFLTRAPQGPARTLAVRRLDRIRPAR